MTLKYKVGDEVILGTLIGIQDCYETYQNGVKVKITEQCQAGTEGEHYTIQKEGVIREWWVRDCEIQGYANQSVKQKEKAKVTTNTLAKPALNDKAVNANKNLRSYAVVDEYGVLDVTDTREQARAIKASHGGKASGVAILQLTVAKEVR